MLTGCGLNMPFKDLNQSKPFTFIHNPFSQVGQSHRGDPFLFVTFRSLCAWLAEETSCLKEEVIALLPFLINYAKGHLEGAGPDKGLSDWMSEMSVTDTTEGGTWSGEDAFR